jgi:HAD superfamily hydrolase (TIGR01509 family)
MHLATSPSVNLEAILFDIDGTLVDSNDIHTECWLEAFREFGHSFEYDVMRGQIGKGGDLLVPDLLTAREVRHIAEPLKKRRGELFKEKYRARVRPFPDAREGIETLHARGLRIVVASSANADEVAFWIDLLGIAKFITGKTSKRDARFSKPSPEIFEAALEDAHAGPDRALVIGDTPYDILAAHRAGIAVAAVRCGGFEEKLLAKAEFLFDNVGELVRRFDDIDEYFQH